MRGHGVGICVALTIGAAGLTGGSAWPAEPDEVKLEAAADAATAMMQLFIRQGTLVEQLRSRAGTIFESEDLDGGGVGPTDDALRAEKERASLRARQVSAMLTHDLDADGAVTEAELRRSLLPQARRPLRSAAGEVAPTAEQVRETLQALVTKAALPDTDGDGRTTIAEVLAAADAAYASRRPSGRPGQVGASFDLDGDGIVTRDEFSAAFDAAISRLDADGDGTISAEEMQAYRDGYAEIRRRAQERARIDARLAALRTRIAGCPVPAVPDDAALVYLGVTFARREALARFTDSDARVMLGDVYIEPGEQPVYLMVAAFTPTLLRFSGAVERLVRVQDIGSRTIGFVGVDAGRIGWFEDRNCGLNDPEPDRSIAPNAALGREFIEALAGRKLDAAVNLRSIGMVAMPSGRDIPLGEDGLPSGPPLGTRSDEAAKGWQKAPPPRPGVLPEITTGNVVAPVPLRAQSPQD